MERKNNCAMYNAKNYNVFFNSRSVKKVKEKSAKWKCAEKVKK